MEGLTAYCFALRRRCEIMDPILVTLKNGRKAVRDGPRTLDAPQHTVFRIVSDAQARQVESQLS